MRIVALLLAAMVTLGTAGCTSPAPAQPAPLRIDASDHPAARVNDLADGVRVIFPRAPKRGSRLQVTTDSAPQPTGRLQATATPVHLHLLGDRVPAGTRIEFPIPAGATSSSAAAGIATWDDAAHRWEPQTVALDENRGVMIVVTDHFSWWEPWTWDWASIGASVDQHVGQLAGERADAPSCTRGVPVPSWAAGLAGISTDDALPIRACAEGDGHGNVAIELVNNRPYGQVLDYDRGLRAWTWQDTGSSASDVGRNLLVNALLPDGKQYLPPLTHASIGLKRPPDSEVHDFHIGVEPAALVGDLFSAVSPSLLSTASKPFAGEVAAACGSALATAPTDPSGAWTATAVFDRLAGLSGCMKAAVVKLGGAGKLDKLEVAKLEAILQSFKQAGRANVYVLAGDLEWKLLDLWQDNRVYGKSSLGAGFSFWSRPDAQPAEPTPAAPRADPAPQPAPPAPKSPDPAPPAPPAPSQPAPPAPQAPPSAAPPVQPKGFTVQVSQGFGGTWARNDPNDGGWYKHDNRPANAAWWYPNGLGVAVGCTRAAAQYKVIWDDGRVEYWHFWAEVTDGKWVPVAVFTEVNGDSDLGLPSC